MEIRRFFVPKNSIAGKTFILDGEEFLHMTKVLRHKVGFKVVVCANDGIERYCTITQINKDCAELSVDEEKTVDKHNVSLTLYAGLLKNQKLDFVIQKAVELGVDSIVPFVSRHTAESKFNLERAQKIALEAAKQCGASYLTQVNEVISFDDMLQDFGNFDTVLFAYENEKYVSIKNAEVKGSNIALVVGSEGGFSAEEAQKATEAGAVAITLGRRILRAETAGIVASALTLDKLGELDYE